MSLPISGKILIFLSSYFLGYVSALAFGPSAWVVTFAADLDCSLSLSAENAFGSKWANSHRYKLGAKARMSKSDENAISLLLSKNFLTVLLSGALIQLNPLGVMQPTGNSPSYFKSAKKSSPTFELLPES